MPFDIVGMESVDVGFPRLKPVISIEDKKHFATEFDKVNVRFEGEFKLIINRLSIVTPRLRNVGGNKSTISIFISN